MALKLTKRIAKAIVAALAERDRIEMRAVDRVLSLIERPPARRRRHRRAPRHSAAVTTLRES